MLQNLISLKATKGLWLALEGVTSIEWDHLVPRAPVCITICQDITSYNGSGHWDSFLQNLQLTIVPTDLVCISSCQDITSYNSSGHWDSFLQDLQLTINIWYQSSKVKVIMPSVSYIRDHHSATQSQLFLLKTLIIWKTSGNKSPFPMNVMLFVSCSAYYINISVPY